MAGLLIIIHLMNDLADFYVCCIWYSGRSSIDIVFTVIRTAKVNSVKKETQKKRTHSESGYSINIQR